ncbi:MAG TPA: DUF5682 family protein [Saprospiraceae bacterium]|nr:DUF5682 family protein [Saprospiraceae bacterium]
MMDSGPTEIRFFGVRHHGPGCANALLQSLEQFAPDCILIEGPENASSMLKKTEAIEALPVAILLYDKLDRNQSYLYPLAVFSPEWIAIKYGLKHRLQTHFIDLPLGVHLPQVKRKAKKKTSNFKIKGTYQAFDYLASLQGIKDAELWWEINFETQQSGTAPFGVLHSLMREIKPAIEAAQDTETLRREAWMRQNIRHYNRSHFLRLAVICGAAHLPFLEDFDLFDEASDAALCAGLIAPPLDLTWVPWSYKRLSSEYGYGAGVRYPMYYEFIFKYRTEAPLYMLAHIAHYLRLAGYDVSPEHSTSAVELAYTLAGIRGLPMPGIDEIIDAGQSVYNMMERTKASDLMEGALIGEVQGSLSIELQENPLLKDFEILMRQYHLNYYRNKTQAVELKLDLRQSEKLQVDIFLQRLKLLELNWCQRIIPTDVNHKGTFNSHWALEWWDDELIGLAQKITYGHTIEKATTGYTIERYYKSRDKTVFLALNLKDVLYSDLAPLTAFFMQSISDHLFHYDEFLTWLDISNELLSILQLGSVRTFPLEDIFQLLEEIIPKIFVNLPAFYLNIAAEEASKHFDKIIIFHKNLMRRSNEVWNREWYHTLEVSARRMKMSPVLKGWATATLLVHDQIHMNEVAGQMSLMLDKANETLESAYWLRYFITGKSLNQYEVPYFLDIMNKWITDLEYDDFISVLPILRKAFSQQDRSMIRLIRKYLTPEKTTSESSNEESLDDELSQKLRHFFINLKLIPE